MLRKPILKTGIYSNSSIDLSAARRRSNRRMLSGAALLVAALAIPAGLALLQPVATDSLPANVDHATAILVASLQQSDALLAGFLPDRAFAEPADDFVTTWKTTAANEIIAIPVDRAAGIYSIDWGDGTTSENVTGDQMHSYASAGNHTVRISGNFTKIYLGGDLDNAPKLVSIDRWGAIKWESMAGAFHGASDMVYRATDVPDLSEVTDMVSMFRNAHNFNGNVSNWDVSKVKEMNLLFSGARSFNQPLSAWDVSNVTSMNSLFEGARSFNQPLNDWNVSQVTDMGWMFNGAHRFNQPLSAWDVSKVTDTRSMFKNAQRFNGNISDWNVSQVTLMTLMFSGAHSFNQPLNDWNVSGVTEMQSMFSYAHNFNQPLNDWDVSKLTSMFRMFDHALKFNQPLNDWDVSRVTGMSYMFQAAKAFNGNISNWNVSRVTDMGWMFWGADKLDQPLNDWDVSSVTRMNHMFWHADKFNQPLNDWNVSSVTRMDSMFWDAVSFNQPLNDWDVSRVTDMKWMFDGATAFDQNLGKWYVLPADTAFDAGDASLSVTTISAQNGFLDDQDPRYGIGAGQNSMLFNVTGNTLMFRSPPDPGNYRINVTASGSVFESGNNWRVLEVTVSSTSNSAPTASAGPDLVLAEGAVFMLNGSATDPNGGGLTYLWTQSPASPVVAFSDTSSPAATITVPQVTADTNVTLTLTATDTSSASATDSLVLAIRETGSAFLTTWNVTETDTTVSIPTYGAYEIIWGDGSAEAVRFSGPQSHSYPAAGTYQVAMTPGLSRIGLSGSSATPERLASIDQWGEIQWTSMQAAFQGASAMTYGAADAPDLSGVTSMVNMLWGATSFNGDISSWNVSNVANMNSMFTSATSFNGNISSWDVSGVASMNSMFASATSFNGNISSWDVSGVTDMAHMFNGATSFNGNISSWDVSDVTGMAHMFYDATSFNGSISSWDVSDVTDMINMFRNAHSFNGNISSWDVSGVTDMSGMFYRAHSFNGDVSSWDVSGVTDMYVMFYRAYSFNGDVSSWDVSNVENMNSMFQRAYLFNGNISSWDVSGVTDMSAMFQGASAFDQNLGNWHVVLDDTVVSNATETLAIRAQNSWLDNRNPTYGLGTGGDSDLFVITGGTLGRNSTVDYSGKTGYSVNITSTGDFGTGNHRVYDITVTGEDTIPDTAPTVTSIERGVPASQTTDSRTLVFKVTFSEDVTGVDQADFVLSSGGTGTGSVTNLAGSGSQYLVSVSAAQDGTYNLDLVSSGHGIADAADNPLADPNPTGADHTYAVDTTAPTVTSIVRSDPAEATTSGRTLVFAVTFSEDVTGVDLSDFALSPGSTGGGSSSGQFTQTSAPAAPITDHNTIQDTITVGPSGTATSVSVAVDITHTYIGDLVVELVAPDGTAQTLHSRSGGSANDIDRTYAPDFDGTGIAGDWTLRIRDHATHDTGTLNSWTLTIDHGGAGSPVTGLAGSGSQYLVTVSAAQDGTYNLDLVPSGHDIADTASNPLTDTVPTTGTDHTYTVSTTPADTTAPTLASIERYSPADQNTDSQTLVYKVTFSEDVTGVDQTDFVLSSGGTGTGSVTNLAGSGSQYLVSVSATQDGTYNLDLVSSGHGIADAADNPLADPNPTGADHTYAVDTTAPTVTSIVRSDPAEATTSGRTLVFAVTFSEDVTGVDQADFVLSSGGTGTGSVTNLAGSGSQYLVSVSATQDGTYNLDLVSSGHGIADAADNPLADPNPTGADHTYAVDTTAPTVTSIVRSDPAEATTSGRTLVFAVTFSEDVTGVDQADFVLSSGGTGTGSVTNLAGSGSQYLVSVSATQDGTYNLDLVSSGHGIADAADNPLSSPAPTGADHTYAVDTTAPTVTSIVRSDPAEATTSGRTLVFAVTFSEDVTGVDQADFVLSSGGTGTGSVTNLAGSGSQYLVSVSATQDGTYNLDLVSSGHGIADAADNPLSSPAPTGADHTYAVDTTAPTVTSIVRSDPAEATTSGRTLVFAVTFSEDVNGVDLSDFALSPDSTGGGSSSGQFTQTSEPALRIADRSTIQDAITVDRSGTATSVSVAVDISHTYRGDLVIVLIAPDGTSQTLHSRTGGSANDIDRTYTPDFDGTGIAGNWTLRVSDRAGGDVGTLNGWTLTIGHGTAGSPVTGLAGSGDAYLVTVSAAQDGTYNLDLVSSGHGITDTPGNPLTDTVPTTGTDHTYTVSTTPADTTAPTLASIERYSPADQNTDSQTLVYKVTFSEDVTGVDQTDFVLSSGGTGTGSVTNLAGSGSQYLVSVSATQDGTYNLDLVSSGHGIADAANNTLSSPVPTGADHTYTVSTASADTTAPTVTSIERSDPAEATTSGRTLVFAVTFSEDVTGVDLSDFALSPGSTGGGSSSGQFTQTSAPAAPITDHNTIQDTITVGPSGTATSVSVAVDITHTYIGDLVVELVAPDGTVQALHSRSGSSANDIDRTYAPGFDGTGIAGDWTLRIRDHATRDTGTLNGWTLTIDHGGADSPVTGLAGSGDAYLVTVSAAQDGTYNLDLVSSGHGITDTPGNPLNDTSPTGEDQSYTVTILNVVPNSMPSVDAGSDQTVQENSVVTLSGTASDADDDPLTYLWSHDSDLTIALSDAASLSTSFTAPQVDSDTTITFTLAAYDETSNATDTTSVTITDSTPPVVADAPRSIGSVTLASTVPGVVEASWDAPAEEPGDYRIAWAKVGEGFRTWTDLTVNAFPTTTSHAITDLEEGAEYKVIVRARYDGGSGDWSGQYTVTVKARVQDTTDPTITLTGANPVSVTTGTAYSDPGATCTDDTDASPTLATTSSVDTLTAGTYQVTYTCTDSSSNMATATRDVVVADAPDTTDPTITLTGANPASVTTGTAYSDPGATCTDDTDASPTLATTSSVDTLTAGTYQVTYTCTDSSSNTATATRDVVVADAPDTTDPTITLTGANPVSVTTGTAYSDPGATCTDDTDASPTLATTSTVDTLTAGTYQVTYTCTDSSSNTATATRDVVVADAPDTTAPTVSSIERHIPTDQNTGSQTLVYQVTFSEDVTGVDAGDFVLSPDSPVAGGASGQFAQTSEPAIPIPDRNTIRDSITVEQSGTATSVSVAVDITHTYIGDLVIDLIAPDGTTRTLHDRTGYETDDIDRTYTPDFGGAGIAGDWTLRVRDGAGGDTGTLNGWTLTVNHGGAGNPVTGLTGSGSQYLVTVSAAQDGTYNLDLVSSGHGITDSASNPLSSPTPTGADHTYTRTSP